MLAIWSSQGGHFQERYELQTEDGCRHFIYWLLTNIDNAAPGVASEVKHQIIERFHCFSMNATEVYPSKLMDIIFEYRTDLSGGGGTSLSAIQKWDWFLNGGFRDYSLPTSLPTISDFRFFDLCELSDISKKIVAPNLIRFLSVVLNCPDSIRSNPQLLMDWFYSHAIWHVNKLINPFGEKVVKLLTAVDQEGGDHDDLAPWVPWFHQLDLASRADDDKCGILQLSLRNWWDWHGAQKYSESNRLLSELRGDEPRLSPLINICAPAEIDVPPKINIIGYTEGGFGLGEDVRLLARSLDLAKLSFSSFALKDPVPGRNTVQDSSLDIDEAKEIKGTVFYVMPAFDTLSFFFKKGQKFFDADRKIGFWQWELSNFPSVALYAYDLIDEVWCHSDHSFRAFKSGTNKIIHKVPLPISVPEISDLKIDLNERDQSTFSFFTSFDGASGIARKNPLGAIEAFQRAFPKNDRGVKLVLKVMNQKNSSLWRECLSRIAADDRIHLINQAMKRDDYYRLLVSSDAVISLHRAEGFGRLMADAMAYSLPVIASQYSGNLDYMDEGNSWLVPGQEIPLLEGDYPFHEGQSWFSPDIEIAAKMMRECREDSEVRLRKSMLGKEKIVRDYSIEACADIYKKILEA